MENVVTVLNDLIKISKDGELGFLQAAENVQDQKLKSIFQEKAEGCRQAIHTLQSHINDLGSEATDTGSMLGAMHRGWVNVKSILTGYDDHAILIECKRGEDEAKKTYENALKENLPEDIRTTVQHQCEGVQANSDLIDSLCKQYEIKN